MFTAPFNAQTRFLFTPVRDPTPKGPQGTPPARLYLAHSDVPHLFGLPVVHLTWLPGTPREGTFLEELAFANEYKSINRALELEALNELFDDDQLRFVVDYVRRGLGWDIGVEAFDLPLKPVVYGRKRHYLLPSAQMGYGPKCGQVTFPTHMYKAGLDLWASWVALPERPNKN